jgi:hypothetical protein
MRVEIDKQYPTPWYYQHSMAVKTATVHKVNTSDESSPVKILSSHSYTPCFHRLINLLIMCIVFFFKLNNQPQNLLQVCWMATHDLSISLLQQSLSAGHKCSYYRLVLAYFVQKFTRCYITLFEIVKLFKKNIETTWCKPIQLACIDLYQIQESYKFAFDVDISSSDKLARCDSWIGRKFCLHVRPGASKNLFFLPIHK